MNISIVICNTDILKQLNQVMNISIVICNTDILKQLNQVMNISIVICNTDILKQLNQVMMVILKRLKRWLQLGTLGFHVSVENIKSYRNIKSYLCPQKMWQAM